MSSYQRPLRLPTSFPISGFARLGTKPRLCRSSWKALASTHPLMLPFTSLGRLSLLAFTYLLGTCLSSLWSPPSPFRPRALIPLFLAKVLLWLALTLSHLTITHSGQTALFLFLLPKAALEYLPTALSVAFSSLFPFQQTQYAQNFPLKPAPFSKLFAGLGSTSKSAISLLFFSYLTLALFSPPCPLLHLSFYLNLSVRSNSNCLFCPPVLSGYNGSSDTRFSRGTTGVMSWLDGERYSCPLQSFVIFLLLSLVSTLLFSRTGCVLSHLNSSNRRPPRFPSRNLSFLVPFTMFPLIYAAKNIAYR